MAKKGFETPSIKVLEIKPQRMMQGSVSCSCHAGGGTCDCDVDCPSDCLPNA